LLTRTLEGLMSLIAEALGRLIEMRQREGEALADELRGQCDVIETNLVAVEARAPQVVANYRDRLTQRVNELTAAAQISIDAEHLAREVAIFAERSDITEELTRLRGHIAQFRQALGATGAVGRKLDFIAQEMLREGNTTAAKCNDADIANAVVDIKSAIDRIKEQVQNIE
jgi:uncharacterized protein (TIGR00255 family)